MSGTAQKFFTAKNVIFLGLKSVILLSKMGERALDSLKSILIWELLIGIYEDIIKVDCSPVFPERSYMRSKKRKKRKKEKTALARLEPGTFASTVQCFATELLGIDISSGCRLFNIKYIIIIASLIYEPHLLIKISTVPRAS